MLTIFMIILKIKNVDLKNLMELLSVKNVI